MDPTHLFELVIAMFLAIIALHYAAQRLGLPPSVGLIVGGALLAFVPGLRAITVDPELVLVIFLPPLLKATTGKDHRGPRGHARKRRCRIRRGHPRVGGKFAARHRRMS